MSQESTCPPLIVEMYEEYLVNQDPDAFVRLVTERYYPTTLERVCETGVRMARRGATLALGLMGDYTTNPALGRALTDPDRGVRTLAEAGIQRVWQRVGTEGQRQKLQAIVRLNSTKQFDDAIRQATALIHETPWFAEAWNQRALAHFNRGEYDESIRDCHQTLEINPYHFPAATGMGKCYLQLSNRVAALESFRRALRLNPGLEDVRAHVAYLQRVLKEE